MAELKIAGDFCISVEQLLNYFRDEIPYGCEVFLDLLDYGRHGDIATWLREHGENGLAKKVEGINVELGDFEYLSEISNLLLGKVIQIDRPQFDDYYTIKAVNCEVLEPDLTVALTCKLLVVRPINETYTLRIEDNRGNASEVKINSCNEKEGAVLPISLKVTNICHNLDNHIKFYAADVVRREYNTILLQMLHLKNGIQLGRTTIEDIHDDISYYHNPNSLYISGYEAVEELSLAVLTNHLDCFYDRENILQGVKISSYNIDLYCSNILCERFGLIGERSYLGVLENLQSMKEITLVVSKPSTNERGNFSTDINATITVIYDGWLFELWFNSHMGAFEKVPDILNPKLWLMTICSASFYRRKVWQFELDN